MRSQVSALVVSSNIYRTSRIWEPAPRRCRGRTDAHRAMRRTEGIPARVTGPSQAGPPTWMTYRCPGLHDMPVIWAGFWETSGR